jgi:hypothetical protein
MTSLSTTGNSNNLRNSEALKGIWQATIGVVLLIASGSASALSIPEEYELQERCGRRAEEIFRKDWGKGMSQNGSAIFEGNYNNHYNKKLNKCFYLIWSTAVTRKGKDQTTTRSAVLYDLNRNKEYGAFSQLDTEPLPSRCAVQVVTCRSKPEFDKLVEPLMNE